MPVKIDINNEPSLAANHLIMFMVKQDHLTDEESEALAEWIKQQEPTVLTDAERHFLLAARDFVKDYPSQLED